MEKAHLLITISGINILIQLNHFNKLFYQDFASYVTGSYLLKKKWKHAHRFFTTVVSKIGIYIITYLLQPFGKTWIQKIAIIRAFGIACSLFTTITIFTITDKIFGTIPAITSSLLYSVYSNLPIIRGWNIPPEKIANLLISLSYYLILFHTPLSFPQILLLSILQFGIILLKATEFFEFAGIIIILILKNKIAATLTFPTTIFLYIAAIMFFYQHFFNIKITTLFQANKTFIKGVKHLNKHIFPKTINRIREQLINFIKYFYPIFLGMILFTISSFRIPISHNETTIIIWFIMAFTAFSIQKSFYFDHMTVLFPSITIISALGYLKWIKIANQAPFKLMTLLNILILTSIIPHIIKILLHLNKQGYFKFFSKTLYTPPSNNPVIQTAEYLKQHTNENNHILVWGWMSEIYFISDTLCATPNLYYFKPIHPYVTVNFPNWKKELLSNIKNLKPEYIVITEDSLNIPLFEQYNNCRLNHEKRYNDIEIFKIRYSQNKTNETTLIDNEHDYFLFN